MANQDTITTFFEAQGLKDVINKVNILLSIYQEIGTVAPSNINKIIQSIDTVSKRTGIASGDIRKFLSEFYKITEGIHGNKIRFLIDAELSKRTIDNISKLEKQHKIPISFDITQEDLPKLQKVINEIKTLNVKSQRDQLTIYKKIQTLIDDQVLKNKDLLLIDDQRNKKLKRIIDIYALMNRRLGVQSNFTQGFVQPKDVKEFEKYLKRLETVREELNQVAKAQQKASGSTAKTEEEQGKLNKQIGVAIGKLIRYRVAFFLMRGAIDATKKSIKDFADTQFLLADLQKVIDQNTDSIKKYRTEAFNLSKTFGVGVGDIIKSMKVWAQTGLKQNDVLAAMSATLVGVNALGSTATEVTEALTSAIFTYGVQASNVTQVISKWLVVQKNFPVTAQDLANSLKAVGAAAKVVGVDLNDLAGYVAAIGAITRKSGSAIGQSLKTMFARLPRKKVISVFENIGVAVLKNASELRDLDDVLDDLHKKWGNLSSVEKAHIAVTFGGIRRYADFIALMDNYNMKTAATIKAQRASTEALQANQLTLNTFKKSWEQAAAALTQFGVIVGQSLAGPLSGLVFLLKGVLKVLNFFHGVLGRIVASVVAFGSVVTIGSIAIAGFKFIMGRLHAKMIEYGIVTGAATAQTIGFEASEEAATASSVGFIGAINGIKLAMGTFGTVLMAASIAIGLISAGWALFGSSQSVASNAVIKTTMSLKDSIKVTEDRIKSLKEENKLTTDVTKELINYRIALDRANKPNIKAGILTKMVADLKLLSNSSYELIDATNTLTNAHTNTTTAINNVITANDNLHKRNIQQIKDLEQINKNLKESRIIQLTGEMAGFTKQIKMLKDFKEKINETFKNLNKTPLPLETPPSELTGKEFQAYFLKRFNFMSFMSDIRKMIFKNQKINLGFEDVFLTPPKYHLKESIDTYIKNMVNAIKDASNQAKESLTETGLAKKYANMLGISDEESKTITYRIQNAVDEAIKTFKDRLVKDKNAIGNISDTKEFLSKILGNKKLTQELYADIGQQLKSTFIWVKGQFGTLGQLGRILNEIGVSIAKDQIEIDKLNGNKNKIKTTLEIGTKPSNDIITFSKSMDSLIKKFKTTTEQFNVLKSSLLFGKVVDENAFKISKMVDIVKTTGTKFQDLAIKISDTTDKINNLTKMKDILETKLPMKNGIINKSNLKVLESIPKLLKDIPTQYSQIAAGSATPIPDINKELTKAKNDLASYKQLLNQLDISKYFVKALKYIREYNKESKENILLQNDINARYDTSIKNVELQLKYLSKFPNKEQEIIALEKERTNLIVQQGKEIAKSFDNKKFPLLSAEKQYKAVLKAANTEHKERIKLLDKEFKIRIDKVMENSVDNAKIFKNTIKDAFTDLPNNILENSQKRKDLSYEIKQAEIDLQNARMSGDQKSIQDAKNRLNLVKDEMKEYRKGWKEIKTIVLDVMSSISDAFYKNLVNQFAENLSNIKVNKNQDVGKLIGDSITNATNNFQQGYMKALSALQTEYATKLKAINKDYQNQLSNIYNTYFVKLNSANDKFLISLKKIIDYVLAALHNIKPINQEKYTNKVVGIKPEKIDTTEFKKVVDYFNTSVNQIPTTITTKIESVEKNKYVNTIAQTAPTINTAAYMAKIVGIKPEAIDTSNLENTAEKTLNTNKSILDATKQNNPKNDPTPKQTVKELNDLQSNLKSFASMISYTLAASLVGTKNKGASVGVGFGSAIGQSLFTNLFKNPGTLMSIFGGPLFGLAGGILGGLFGGLFGHRPKKQEPLSKAMDQNTNATIQNTIALKEIDKKIYNAPTRFNLPTGNYGYGNPAITIHINSTNDAHIAETIKQVLSGDYDVQIQNSGSRGFVPV